MFKDYYFKDFILKLNTSNYIFTTIFFGTYLYHLREIVKLLGFSAEYNYRKP